MNGKQAFLDWLVAAASAPNVNEALMTEQLRERILAFGSETPDNLDCSRRLAVESHVDEDRRSIGVSVAGIGSVSALVQAAEGSPIPDQVREAFSDLSQEQWDAVLRYVTLLLIALENDRP